MDKNTIRQERLAQGVNPNDCECEDISDNAVIDRLYAMGATHILEAPILTVGQKYSGYDSSNKNQVFIGYSRTDTLRTAIKGIMLFTDPLGTGEPAESVNYGGKLYKLVAEPATAVPELPKAINLIGIEDAQDTTCPKVYLYTTTTGTDPIREFSIGSEPIRNGWTTALSQNGKEAFADLSDTAATLRDAIYEEDKNPYTEASFSRYYLSGWYNLVYRLFTPSNRLVSDWYLYYKTYSDDSIEQTKPYIGNVCVAEGGTRKEALIRLLEGAPDGFIDTNLNQGANGKHIYLGYTRTNDTSTFGAILTDIAVYSGSVPAKTQYVNKSDQISIRYDLLSLINLNAGAGGSEMYLYTATNTDAGEYLTGVSISTSPQASGANSSVAVGISNSAYTGGGANLNEGTSGSALYITMTRQPKSDDAVNNLLSSFFGNGSLIIIGICITAGAIMVILGAAKIKKSNKCNRNK
jgi:hypothetical protein